MKTIYQSPMENRASLISLGAELHSWLIKMMLSVWYTYITLRHLTCYWMILKNGNATDTQKWQTTACVSRIIWMILLFLSFFSMTS